VVPFRISRALLPALLLAVLPTAALAQQPAPAAPQEPPQEVQAWLVEMQQLHGRLEGIQEKAMADPTLSEEQQALGTSIREAMMQVDPALEQSMTRMQALEAEAAAAQQQGDQAKLQQIGMEAQQIQQRFVSAQQQALQQPELSAKVEAFQDRLEQKMREVDPEAEKLIARFQELEEKLAAAMGATPRG
jgi:predicted  nucleic acid-binding Zn-ribbon protein